MEHQHTTGKKWTLRSASQHLPLTGYRLLLTACCFLPPASWLLPAACAQQVPQYSQYMLNTYAYNPAVSGSDNHYQLRMNYRNQWVGIDGSPKTYFLSYYGRNKRNEQTALGTQFFSDHAGPVSRTGLHGSYTHHVKLRSETKLALGLSLGMVNFSLNATDIVLADPDDLAFSAGKMSSTVPDANFGIYLYNPKYFIGLSANQLFQNELTWPYTDSKVTHHYFALAGYRFSIKGKVSIEPSALLKYVDPVPPQIDAGLRFGILDTYWLGAQYRTEDAIAFLAGYTHSKKLFFGYSYDMTTSALKNYTSGTHEIVIGYRFMEVVEEESQMDY